MVESSEYVGAAFGLVTIAGLSTALGAVVVLFPALAKYATAHLLAGSLAFSAGVMTYVSFVEIFQKSIGSFEDAGHSEGIAYSLATACFFLGCVIVALLDLAIHAIQNYQDDDEHTGGGAEGTGTNQSGNHCAGICVSDLGNVLQQLVDKGEDLGLETGWDDGSTAPHTPPSTRGVKPSISSTPTEDTNNQFKEEQRDLDDENTRNRKLMRTSLKTATAIAIHNFPEGLATFVAALEDPKVGLVLTLAIAIHNIPEGLCVALPIFYATKSKLKAFGWALLSGITEILAAFLGWAVLANNFNDDIYGSMFGLVAGMMVMISIRELLPTAHRYDERDKVSSPCFAGGMLVMALSLVLFAV